MNKNSYFFNIVILKVKKDYTILKRKFKFLINKKFAFIFI